MSTRAEKVTALRAVLVTNGLTQASLAGAIGISTGALSEFLNYEKAGSYVLNKITMYLDPNVQKVSALRNALENDGLTKASMAEAIGITTEALSEFLIYEKVGDDVINKITMYIGRARAEKVAALRAVLEDDGLTQASLAEAIGITTEALSEFLDYEKASSYVVYKISLYLGPHAQEVAALRAALKIDGLTQASLAEAIGISTEGLSEFLSYKKIGSYVLNKITMYLDPNVQKVSALRNALENDGLTQASMAEAIGISTKELSDFFGYKKVGDDILNKITMYLDSHTVTPDSPPTPPPMTVDEMREIVVTDVSMRVSGAMAHEIGISGKDMRRFLIEKTANPHVSDLIREWCSTAQAPQIPSADVENEAEELDSLDPVSSTDSESESDSEKEPVAADHKLAIRREQIVMTQSDYDRATTGYLYVMSGADPMCNKIGRTTDIFSRMRNLSQGNPDIALALLVRTRNHVFAETQLKTLLGALKYHSRVLRNVPSRNIPGESSATEWYNMHLDDIRQVVLDVAAHTDYRMGEFDALSVK